MPTLKQYICGRKNRIPRGAVSRVAEFLKVHHAEAFRAIMGYSKSEDIARRSQDFVAMRGDFSSRKPGKKTSLHTEAILDRYDAGEPMQRIAEDWGITREGVRQIALKNGRKSRNAKKLTNGFSEVRTSRKSHGNK